MMTMMKIINGLTSTTEHLVGNTMINCEFKPSAKRVELVGNEDELIYKKVLAFIKMKHIISIGKLRSASKYLNQKPPLFTRALVDKMVAAGVVELVKQDVENSYRKVSLVIYKG